MLNSKQTNKFIYKCNIKRKSKNYQNTSYIKWNEIFTDIDWKHTHLMPFKSTIDTKLRTFQYKFLMRILPCNKKLYKQKLVNSTLCDFCAMNVETTTHLFWECNVTRAFWAELQQFLHNKDFIINFNLRTISFGLEKRAQDSCILNFLIILAKYYIFRCKYNKNEPEFIAFVQYLKQRKNIEETIAIIKDKTDTHNMKWIKLQDI